MVKGPDAHPFYHWAAQERPLETPRWNFHKYLIGRDGRLKATFVSAVEPTDPQVISAIETELAPESPNWAATIVAAAARATGASVTKPITVIDESPRR